MMSEPKNDPAQMFQQIMQQLTQSDAGVKDDGLGVDGFSTETVRPMESLDDGGIIPLHGVTGDFNAYLTFEDYDASKAVDYNPFVTVDYLF
jgi:hypothetical protein